MATDYAGLNWWLTVNGEEAAWQYGCHDTPIPIPKLIASVTLEPGDCVLTGAPVGVGPVPVRRGPGGGGVGGGTHAARPRCIYFRLCLVSY
jgi:2-keto-4-pentenoate hydratase/2-oxohepta-3-ene-1,7-dioic acid hydratase in catechol pathway